MLEHAKQYIEMGYSVIPLRPGGKEPLIKWQEFTERKATESEILKWFASGDNNLGLVSGRISGFVVVDVDGPDGLESAAELGLNSTTVSLTGKGKQFFYAVPASPVRNAVRVMPGIDIRSEGGYVCAPPSRHENGKTYAWILGPSPDLPAFPESVVAAIAKTEVSGKVLRHGPGWVSAALDGLTEGNRNDTFAQVVGKLHRSGLDKTTIWTLLLPYARSSGFPDAELNSVIQSITGYPTQVSPECTAASAEQFLSDSAPVSWLCNPICARGSIGFTAGLPESYKTWLLMDLAIECSRGGGLWLGLFPVIGGRTLFIDQERSKVETQRRLKGMLTAKGIDSSALRESLFIRSGTTTRIDLDDSYRAFKRELSQIRPDLLLIDSFATFHTSEENDRMAIQKVIERIKEIRTEFNCAIIFIDHENKSAFSDGKDGITPNAFRMVGSVGKIAAAEFVLTVRRYDPTTCMCYHTKSTLGPRVPSFTVHVVDTENGGIRVFGEQGKA